MYRPPPLRGQPILDGRKVLLIDANQPTRDVRIRVLQSHGVEVRAADSFSGARFLWRPNVYDLILLDVRRHLPGEALEFYEQIKTASPKEHFAFLVGPPVYLSRTWPGEVIEVDVSLGQWGATVRRFLAAARRFPDLHHDSVKPHLPRPLSRVFVFNVGTLGMK